MNIQVRNVTEDDAAAIYGFICTLENTKFDYDLFTQILLSNIANTNNHYLVAITDDGSVAGFISCHVQLLLHHCGKVAEIQELYVPETQRQLGIGRLLAEHLEQILSKENCLTLEVTAQNKREAAHRFYESLQFQHTHKKFVKDLTAQHGQVMLP